jgi:hypothetical protein
MNPILPRAIPFAVFIAFIALDGPLAQLSAAIGMDARWWYAVRVAIVALLLAWFWRGYVELDAAMKIGAAGWSITIAVGIAVFVVWITLDFQSLTFGSSPGYDPRGHDGGIHAGMALTRLAGAALVVPLMEELFWRSFLMRWIHSPRFLEVDARAVGMKALAVSAVLFALEHHQWFAGLLAGLAYGWLYLRTGNLWTAVVAHGITNALLGAWVLITGAWQFW